MNMIEALKLISAPESIENVAARPVSWSGKGVGIIRVASMFVFASNGGFALAPLPGDECWADWETVTLEVIEAETDGINAANKAVIEQEAKESTESDK